jgi:hypothetical protein
MEHGNARIELAPRSWVARAYPQPDRSWVETVYPGLSYFNEVDKGGHFAASEEPQIFSEELRAMFAPLR